MTDDQTLKWDRVIEDRFGWFLLVSASWVGSGLAVLLWQTLIWLRTAHWHPIRLGDALTLPIPRDWHGIQHLLRWALNLPLSAILFCSGILAFLSALGWADRLSRRAGSIKFNRQWAEKRAAEEAGFSS